MGVPPWPWLNPHHQWKGDTVSSLQNEFCKSVQFFWGEIDVIQRKFGHTPLEAATFPNWTVQTLDEDWHRKRGTLLEWCLRLSKFCLRLKCLKINKCLREELMPPPLHSKTHMISLHSISCSSLWSTFNDVKKERCSFGGIHPRFSEKPTVKFTAWDRPEAPSQPLTCIVWRYLCSPCAAEIDESFHAFPWQYLLENADINWKRVAQSSGIDGIELYLWKCLNTHTLAIKNIYGQPPLLIGDHL